MSATREHVDLPITGMTCASCANRIERRLNKLDGVTATVNYATEKASVEYDGATVAADELSRRSRPRATEPSCPRPSAAGPVEERPDERLRRRLHPVGRPVAAGAADLDGAGVPVRQLAVARAQPGHAGRPLGRLAVPRGRVGEPQARHRDDGHARLAGRALRVAVVGLRTVHRRRRHARHAHELRPDPGGRWRRRRDLSGDRVGRDDVHPRRALLRGARQAPRRRGAEGAARARRQGRRRPRRRRQRAPHPDRAAAGGRPLRRAPGREGRHRRHRRDRAPRRST